MDAKYVQRRDYMYKRLTAMGFDCTQPMGAFYIFAKIPAGLEQDDTKLIYDIVKKARVAVTAGSFFGAGGEGYLRFSYATSMDQIREGMDRLAKYVENQWSTNRHKVRTSSLDPKKSSEFSLTEHWRLFVDCYI